MSPSDGGTAVSTPHSSYNGGFTFNRPAQWAGATVDAPLSAFRSPQHGLKLGSSDSPQRLRTLGSSTSSGSNSNAADRQSSASQPTASHHTKNPSAPRQHSPSRHGSGSASSAPAAEAPSSAAENTAPLLPPPGSWAASTSEPPQGMDASSFAAGERAALLRAFREALPGQAAIGELRAATQALQGRQDADGTRLVAVQSESASLRASMQSLAQRLTILEESRLPALDARIDVIASAGPSQEFRHTLAALQQVLGELAARPAAVGGSVFSPPAASAVSATVQSWAASLIRGVGSAAWGAVSQADTAALALARRVLLPLPTSVAQDTADSPAGADAARAVLGAALLVAATEAAVAAQRRAAAVAPRAINQAAAPLRTGLSAGRLVVWAAALALSAARARAVCFALADLLVSAAQRAASSRGVQRAAAMMRQGTSRATSGAPVPKSPARDERGTARALAEEAAARTAARAQRSSTAGAAGLAATPPPAPASGSSEAGSGSELPQRMSVAEAVAAAEAARTVDFESEADEIVYELDDFPSM